MGRPNQRQGYGGGNRRQSGKQGGGYGDYGDSYDRGYGGYLHDNPSFGGGYRGMDGGRGMFQDQQLQQQLSIREMQLATASNLLKQQSQFFQDVGMMSRRSLYDDYGYAGSSRYDDPPMRYGKRPGDNRGYGDAKRRRTDSSSHGNRGGPGKRQGKNSDNKKRNQGQNKQQKRSGEENKRFVKDKSLIFCHACDIQFETYEKFRSHRRSESHLTRMTELKVMPEEESKEIFDKIKQQQEAPNYCMICDREIFVPYKEHKERANHKFREQQVGKGCGWCGIESFKDFAEIVAHRSTLEHIQNQLMYGTPREAPTEPTIGEDGFQTYAKGVPVGQNYVVRGFYCKLCEKFSANETAVKLHHCGSEYHYERWKKAEVELKEENDRLKKEAEEKAAAEKAAAEAAAAAEAEAEAATAAEAEAATAEGKMEVTDGEGKDMKVDGENNVKEEEEEEGDEKEKEEEAMETMEDKLLEVKEESGEENENAAQEEELLDEDENGN